MAESKSSATLWIAGIAGLIAIAIWFALDETRDTPERSTEASVQSEIPASPTKAAQQVESHVLRFATQGRLSIDAAALPTEGPLTLELELDDEARGSGELSVLVVSTDGRRIDTMASSLPGAGSGVHLEIDPGFLTRGRYMIQINTEDKHPLQIRRYVLELR